MSEREILRRLIDACAQTFGNATRSDQYSAEHVHEIVTVAQRRFQAIADDSEWQQTPAVGLRFAVRETFQVIHARVENRSSPPGLATGFARLDELTGGFMPGDLIALASEPCAGKSALAAQVALHCAMQDKQPVCVFSMKRAATEYVMRLIAAIGSIDRQHLRDGSIDEKEWPRITNAIQLLNDENIVIDASTTQSIVSLRSRMRAALRLHAVRLVVIDSLELLEKPEHAADLRSIAREFDAAVLVLAQTRGAVDAYTRLRDTALEDNADAILLLDRDQTNAGDVARIIVARNRNGLTGEINLRYLQQFARFEEASKP